MSTHVPQRDDVEHWTVEQVAAWLQQMELSECCDTFLRRGIDGHKFLQLSEGNLYQWSRDISIHSRMQILKLVSQIKGLQQYPSTTRQPHEISRSSGSRPYKNYNDHAPDFTVKDFCGEEELEEYIQTPPVPPRHHGPPPPLSASLSFPRMSTSQNNNLHGHGSRSLEAFNDDAWDSSSSSFDDDEAEEHPEQRMYLMKENDPGEDNLDDLYLVPLPASSPSSNFPNTLNREFPVHPQRSNNTPFTHGGGLPWNVSPAKKDRFGYGSDSQNNGRSQSPALPERAPVRPPRPPPDALTASQNKQHSPMNHFQGLTAKGGNHSPLQEAINHGLVENGIGGGKGGSFLHRPQFHSNGPPRWHTGNGPSQATQSMEKNDHVYEIVDVPQGSYGGTETPSPNRSDQQSPIRPPVPPPRNQTPDIDERDLSSRLVSASLSQGKRPPAPLPPLARTSSRGQVLSQAPPPPALPARPDRNRQTNTPPVSDSSSYINPNIVPKETHAPGEFPPKSAEVCLPFINMGNGESIELIPLYKRIMERPFFQFVSRSKAKELVLQGEEGTFIIRPSTRTKMPLTLTVKHDDRSYNINIRQRPDGLFALGYEKSLERKFSSIDEIVSTHRKEPITLANGDCALLKHSPKKPSSSLYIDHVPPGSKC